MEIVQTLGAWLLSAVVLLAAYPWATWLLALTPAGKADTDRDLPLRWLLALAICTGSLTLLMLGQDMLGLWADAFRTTVLYLPLMAVGWWLARGQLRWLPARRWPVHGLTWLALAVGLIVSSAVLFNATYWPFYHDDAIGIYNRFGRLLPRDGTIVGMRDEGPYSAYPMLASLLYAYTYLASGWINEYLAGFWSALLSLANLLAVYLLGREIGGARTGWLALLLLALSRAFSYWASSGYVDLPMAFFYTLVALFALRLWRQSHWADALLAGILLGLATWTKNAALVGVGVLAVWLLAAWFYRRTTWRALVAAALGCAAVGAPWYLRNLAYGFPIIPATAWVDQAEQTVEMLLLFLTRPHIYGLSGVIMFGGLVLAGLVVLWRRQSAPAWMVLLLWWALPFYAAWWLFVNYDPRFLLLFLPVMSVLGAYWLLRLWDRLPVPLRPVVLGVAVALVVVITAQNTWNSVAHKDNILANPLMSHQEKIQVVRSR